MEIKMAKINRVSFCVISDEELLHAGGINGRYEGEGMEGC